jgi:hypothetical protein
MGGPMSLNGDRVLIQSGHFLIAGAEATEMRSLYGCM